MLSGKPSMYDFLHVHEEEVVLLSVLDVEA